MKITVTEAAQEWHVTRQTIYSRINAGELSSETVKRGKRNVRLVEHSEMIRVFGEPGEKRTRQIKPSLPDAQTQLINTLQKQLDLANERIGKLEGIISAKDEKILELLREIQGDFTKLLEDKRQPEKKGLFDIFK